MAIPQHGQFTQPVQRCKYDFAPWIKEGDQNMSHWKIKRKKLIS
jgi:hypothetical protein